MCIYYHFALQFGTFMIYFSLFHIEIGEIVAGLLRGMAKGMLPPPLENYWGPAPPPLAPPPPSSFTYDSSPKSVNYSYCHRTSRAKFSSTTISECPYKQLPVWLGSIITEAEGEVYVAKASSAGIYSKL